MNKKGFATVLVGISIFFVTIIMLSSNYYQEERIDYSQIIIDSKIKITNYEIVLNQAIQDCNWQKPNNEIQNCVNLKANNLKQEIFDEMNKCEQEDFIFNDINSLIGKINCHNDININKTFFSIDLNKNIILKRYK